jgi:hypothetical protein
MEELLSRKVGGNFKKKACVKAHGTALRRQKQKLKCTIKSNLVSFFHLIFFLLEPRFCTWI